MVMGRKQRLAYRVTPVEGPIMYSQLLTFLLLVVALFDSLFSWIGIMVVLFVVWRFAHERNKTRLPSRTAANVLAITCSLLIAWFAISNGILNGMTNLLLLATALKMLIIKKTEEIGDLCLALYFTIASAFIYKQGIGYTAFVLLIFLVNTYTLMMVHSPGLSMKARTRYATRFVLTTIPFALLLFILVPRGGPLWKMPSAKGSTTGLSEQISPGDFSSLAQSSKLAFRVSFDGDIPENQDLYWRTMVHERFNGKTWTVDRFRKAPQNIGQAAPPRATLNSGPVIKYQVIAEPSYQDWLYTLDTPVNHSDTVRYHYDRRISAKTPVTQKFQYEVTSSALHQHQLFTFELERQINLLQPRNINPRAQALARELRAQSKDDMDFIQKVMNYFVDNNFVYTLEPPLMPVDPVDQFLFQARAGFCSHYASAFAVLMRAAGIPARLVSGYQGGERADGDDYLSVYQYEAHAWNEVWLDGRGWLRLDPTSWVSPERIALGLQGAFDDDEGFLSDEVFNLVKYKQIAAVNWLRNQLNNLDFYWSTWILNFNAKKQSRVLETLWGKRDALTYALYSAMVFSAFLAIIWWFSRHGPGFKPQSKLVKNFRKLQSAAKKLGFEQPAHVPPVTWLGDLAQAYPDLAPTIDQLKGHYSACLYQQLDDSQMQIRLKAVKKLTRELRRRFTAMRAGKRLGLNKA